MFGNKDNRKMASAKRLGKGATLIADSTKITGDVHFADQLFVNGMIEGNISAELDSGAMLVISDVGKVKGEIRVPYVVVNGQVEGDVYASTRVELAANARISGNLYYNLIEMQLGAMVDGQLVHLDPVTKPGKAGAATVRAPAAAGEADKPAAHSAGSGTGIGAAASTPASTSSSAGA